MYKCIGAVEKVSKKEWRVVNSRYSVTLNICVCIMYWCVAFVFRFNGNSVAGYRPL